MKTAVQAVAAALILLCGPAAALEADPLRSADQRALELQAARLLAHPDIQAARRRAADLWRREMQPPLSAELAPRFEQVMDEMTMAALLNIANRDTRNPRIHLTQILEHEVDATRVASSRYAIDNPDTLYRTIPIDGTSRYVLEGRRPAHPPVVNEFSLLTRELSTIANLSGPDLEVAADGRFTLTIGPEPAAGRRNHIQTTQDAFELLVRDTLGDWSVERPNALSVRREGAAGPPAPRPDAAVVRDVVAAMEPYVRDEMRFIGLSLKEPPNSFRQPYFSRDNGMLATQAYSLGRFVLADDEALVITVQAGGAPYVTVPINNMLGTSNDPAGHLASLNNRQAAPNLDGSFTVVATLRDPGLYNWLDPEGLHEGLISVRWAGFPTGIEPRPAIAGRLVKLKDLEAALPAGMRRVSADERRDQLARRARDYAGRSRE